jgi:nitrite reductase/ring-hydroxylating ferredoxin subunit
MDLHGGPPATTLTRRPGGFNRIRYDGGVFRKIGTVRQFREGRGRSIAIGGRTIAVFRVGGRLHAFGDRCPHMGASLSLGRVAGGKLQCSWHAWRFDLATGRHERKDWARIPVYEVRVEGEDVLVEIPEPEPEVEDPA